MGCFSYWPRATCWKKTFFLPMFFARLRLALGEFPFFQVHAPRVQGLQVCTNPQDLGIGKDFMDRESLT